MAFNWWKSLKAKIFGSGMTIPELKDLLSEENIFREQKERQYMEKVWLENDYRSNESTQVKLEIIAKGSKNSDLVRENAVTLIWRFARHLQVSQPAEVIEDAKATEEDVVIPSDVGMKKSVFNEDFSSLDKPVKLGLLNGSMDLYSDLGIDRDSAFYMSPLNEAARNSFEAGIEDRDEQVRSRAVLRALEGMNILENLEIDFMSVLNNLVLSKSEIENWEKERLLDEYTRNFKLGYFEENLDDFISALLDNTEEDLSQKITDIQKSVLTPEKLEKHGLTNLDSDDLSGKKVDEFSIEISDAGEDEAKIWYADRERLSELKGVIEFNLDGDMVKWDLTGERDPSIGFIAQGLVQGIKELDERPIYATRNIEMRKFNGRYHVKINEFDTWSIKEDQFLKALENLWTVIESKMDEAGVGTLVIRMDSVEVEENLTGIMKDEISSRRE